MEKSVELLAIILFGVVGLSHILQPKGWAEFFILLRGSGEAGAFVDGFLNLPLGAVIVVFHNVWSGIPIVLTLVGWGLLIKGLIRFCAPQQGLRMMARVCLGVPSGWRRPRGSCRLPWLWRLRWVAVSTRPNHGRRRRVPNTSTFRSATPRALIARRRPPGAGTARRGRESAGVASPSPRVR